jgi:threonine aldolase
MIFASDNWAGASPRVLEALAGASRGFAPSYGDDEATRQLGEALSDLFEREVAIALTPTGTAANALGLAAFCPPYGAILAHEGAHIVGDECGAPEFFSQGGRLVPIAGSGGKLTPEGVLMALSRLLPGSGVRFPQPSVLSITQAAEIGTVYRPEEIAALAAIAHERGLALHMDGARFANAVAFLGCRPADITWRAGVDVLSFGGTKNGAMMAEAVVFFDPSYAKGEEWRRRRGGHVVSKARLIASQFLALLADGHWLELAAHANAMAARLAAGLAARGFRIPWPVEANEVFPILPKEAIARLREAGARFHEWPAAALPPEDRLAAGEDLVRLVASFATTPAEVDRFLDLAGQWDSISPRRRKSV